MAQNITLLGASYTDVPAVELPKSGGGTARFDDASVTTAVAEDVASGKVFLASNGAITLGTNSGGAKLLMVSASSVSALPHQINHADITADMAVVQYTLSAPYTQTSDWTATTAAGSVTINGSMNSNVPTDIELILAEVSS